MQSAFSLDDLGISPCDVLEEMGWRANASNASNAPNGTAEAAPEAVTRQILPLIEAMISETKPFVHARYLVETVENDVAFALLHPSKIILRQLRGSERTAVFVATAGWGFEAFQETVRLRHDDMREFILNALGSLIAERTGDLMQAMLRRSVAFEGERITNRFSPGYCGWDIREQPLLFSLFNEDPCGVLLTESCLMRPVKSISGIIGIGQNAVERDYSCRLCSLESCYKRRRK